MDCVKGFRSRILEENRQTDALNHILGEYVMYGVNAPKKYPRTPRLTTHDEEQDKGVKFTTDEQRIHYVRLKYGR